MPGMDLTEAISNIPTGSPEDVAAFLQERGVRGVPTDAESCPIASYLLAETGRLCKVAYYSAHPLHKANERYLLPSAVGLFISEFDHGVYPELDSSQDEV